MPDEPLDITFRVIDALDRLRIPYVLGGSLASSIVGEPRATADADVAIRIREDQLEPLVSALQSEFYVSLEAAREALARKSSFNLIHLESLRKVDLFVLGDDPLDQRQLHGRVRVVVNYNPRRELWVGSPVDQILRKLSWYRAGGEASERQWRDVLGILDVQLGRLDRASLREAARDLGLDELVERAIREADSQRS